MQKSLKNLLSCSWRWSQRYENLSCLLSLTQNYIKIFSASHEFKEIFQAKRFWCIESVPKHVTITLDQGSFIALGNVFTIVFTFFVQSLHHAWRLKNFSCLFKKTHIVHIIHSNIRFSTAQNYICVNKVL